MRCLYSYTESFGRMGDLEGLFIADDHVVAKAQGKTAYFGEVLGKHSEVYTDEWASNTSLVTNDPSVIEIIEKHGLETGFNPLNYISEDEDGR